MTPFSREAVRLATVIALAALAACAIYLVASGLIGKAKRQAAEARAGQAMAGARSEAAREAVATVVQNSERVGQIDTQTQENRDAILSAPGAGALLDPRLGDAGRRAICLRNSAHDLPECRALFGARP